MLPDNAACHELVGEPMRHVILGASNQPARGKRLLQADTSVKAERKKFLGHDGANACATYLMCCLLQVQ